VPLVPSTAVDIGLFAAAGCGTGPLLNALLTTRHREAPPDAHTQVFTLGAGMKSTAAAVGAAVSGMLAGWAGAALVLGVAVCQLVGAAAGTLILRGRAEGNGDADAL
jgi:hypothetical protein